jgi:hypothetical protein
MNRIKDIESGTVFWFFVFVVSVVLCLMYVQIFDNEEDYMFVTVDDGSARITRYVGSKLLIRIPREIQGIPVTEIGDGVFRNRKLFNVSIPNGVKTIGNEAFLSNRLITVTIPDSVTSIGTRAFYGNYLLVRGSIGANVEIENTLATVGSREVLNLIERSENFIDFYIMNGRRAGAYSFNATRRTVRFK